jgi:hypothetical protein
LYVKIAPFNVLSAQNVIGLISTAKNAHQNAKNLVIKIPAKNTDNLNTENRLEILAQNVIEKKKLGTARVIRVPQARSYWLCHLKLTFRQQRKFKELVVRFKISFQIYPRCKKERKVQSFVLSANAYVCHFQKRSLAKNGGLKNGKITDNWRKEEMNTRYSQETEDVMF